MRGVKSRDSEKWKKLAIFLVLLLLFGVLLNSVRKVYKKKESAEKALARMQSEVQTLTEREKFLEDSLLRLSTDEGIKFEIKKKLNVAEVGESVAIIVESDESVTTPSSSISPWQRLKNFFSDLFN